MSSSRTDRTVTTAAGTRLVLIARNFTETSIDNPPEGFSQGDEEAVSAALFRRNGDRVGGLDAHDVITFLDEAAGRARVQVVFTASLRSGRITATGVFVSTEETVLSASAAVTGGTRRYREAGGDVQAIFTEDAVRLVYDLEDL